MKENNQWVAQSLQHVWHPCTQMQHHETLQLIPISRGQGVWLYDAEGNRYLDGISSWWVNLFGHANPRINNALKQQLDKLEHVMLAGFTHEPVIELSEKLSQLTERQLGHCFYASDGASAVEIALKMSAHSWLNAGHSEKHEFVCLQGSYHGETLGALSVTDVDLFRNAYGSLIQSGHVVASPDARNAKPDEIAQDVAARALQDVERLFAERSQHIAAMIVEPLVQCATGFAMHDPAYLTGLRELCDRYQIHLIADEIAVGCGRTGTFFACEQANVWPDFLCLSKGISGGYLPLSLVMTTNAIYQCFYDADIRRGFLHSHSYTGNPLACRAALATLAIFEEDRVIERNRNLAQKISTALQSVQQFDEVINFRQRGMITAFDVDGATPDFARRFFAQALQHELLLRPIGNTVYFMPPYVINEADIDFVARQLMQILKKVLRNE